MAGNNKKGPRKGGLRQLKARLASAEDTIAAIRGGEVDALLVSGPGGDELLTLAGAENGYRVFVENMSEGAVTCAVDGTIVYCNRGFGPTISRSVDELIDKKIFDFVPDSDKPGFDALFRLSAEKSRGRIEMRLIASTGALVPVFISLSNFPNAGLRAVCLVVTDLTEQKRQEEIVAAGRLAALIIEQAFEAIAVCDSKGQVVLASRALHRLCGCNPLLRRFEEMLILEHWDTSRLHRFSLSDIACGRRYHSIEVFAKPEPANIDPGLEDGPRLHRPHQEKGVHMLLSASPIKLPYEETVGCVITLVDIEERKRAEEALRRSEKLAATGRLAATIAHEINNPLESITNLLYLIGGAPGLIPAAQDYVRIAQTELERVARITKQTLTFHRTSNKPEPIRIPEMIDSVIYLYARHLLGKGIELRKEVTFNGEVLGFPNELRQVISNLIDNALEACPHRGKLYVRVYPSAEWNNSHKPGVRIVIADNGRGIPLDTAAHIFEPFFTTKGAGGSGLGLWVSQGIILKHGGSICVRSSVLPQRSGTVFSIFLPLKRSEDEVREDRQFAAD